MSRFSVRTAFQTAAQKLGALALDRAAWHLGLGRQGARLTGASLRTDTERWEVEIGGWRTSLVAEAAELMALRSLSTIFDLQGGETVHIENLNLRWLKTRPLAEQSGLIRLSWTVAERELFRRETLSNLTEGAVVSLTAFGFNEDDLAVVQIDIDIRARARLQISSSSRAGV